MSLFSQFFSDRVPSDLIPINPANARNSDWVILIEAGTIVGPSTERIRVARSTQERKVIKRYDLLLRSKHYLVIKDYNPRIHSVYLCPQLYKYDDNQKLVPLQGEEIGQLIAHALNNRVAERRPWYDPAEKLPDEPIIGTQPLTEFDTVVVEMPSARNAAAKAS